jgi:hypothetical protein
MIAISITNSFVGNRDETNQISANGNSTVCTSVRVPGSGYHMQSLSRVVQIHTTQKKKDITLYYYNIRVQLFGTSRVQVQQD